MNSNMSFPGHHKQRGTIDHSSIHVGIEQPHEDPILRYLSSSPGTTFVIDTAIYLLAFWILQKSDRDHEHHDILAGTYLAGIRIGAAAASPAAAAVIAVHSMMCGKPNGWIGAGIEPIIWVCVVPALLGIILRAAPALLGTVGGDKLQYSAIASAIQQVGKGGPLTVILGLSVIPMGWVLTWIGQACIVVGLSRCVTQCIWSSLGIHNSWTRPFALFAVRAAGLYLAYASGLYKATFNLTALMGLFHGY